jgi:NADH dehydrogenase [ubiquinone] 1 alpha subcomplex assembly factor 2
MFESNTKFCNDPGLQRKQNVSRGEVGTDLGGKGIEVEMKAGEDNRGRAHGLRTTIHGQRVKTGR